MRRPRTLVENARYHVTAQINAGEFLLEDKKIKELFKQVIKNTKNKKKYRFIMETFTIMGNHVHFQIKPRKGCCLSRIMQSLLGSFAIRYNKICRRKGHVWYDRFHSTIIETFTQYINTFRYINENPVKAGIVKRAEDYPHGGLWLIKRKIFDIVDPPNSILKRHFPEL